MNLWWLTLKMVKFQMLSVIELYRYQIINILMSILISIDITLYIKQFFYTTINEYSIIWFYLYIQKNLSDRCKKNAER